MFPYHGQFLGLDRTLGVDGQNSLIAREVCRCEFLHQVYHLKAIFHRHAFPPSEILADVLTDIGALADQLRWVR